jgi:hypothetical protein
MKLVYTNSSSSISPIGGIDEILRYPFIDFWLKLTAFGKNCQCEFQEGRVRGLGIWVKLKHSQQEIGFVRQVPFQGFFK